MSLPGWIITGLTRKENGHEYEDSTRQPGIRLETVDCL